MIELGPGATALDPVGAVEIEPAAAPPVRKTRTRIVAKEVALPEPPSGTSLGYAATYAIHEGRRQSVDKACPRRPRTWVAPVYRGPRFWAARRVCLRIAPDPCREDVPVVCDTRVSMIHLAPRDDILRGRE